MLVAQLVVVCASGRCRIMREKPHWGAWPRPTVDQGITPHGLCLRSLCASKLALQRGAPGACTMITRLMGACDAERARRGSHSVAARAAPASPALRRKSRRVVPLLVFRIERLLVVIERRRREQRGAQ